METQPSPKDIVLRGVVIPERHWKGVVKTVAERWIYRWDFGGNLDAVKSWILQADPRIGPTVEELESYRPSSDDPADEPADEVHVSTPSRTPLSEQEDALTDLKYWVRIRLVAVLQNRRTLAEWKRKNQDHRVLINKTLTLCRKDKSYRAWLRFHRLSQRFAQQVKTYCRGLLLPEHALDRWLEAWPRYQLSPIEREVILQRFRKGKKRSDEVTAQAVAQRGFPGLSVSRILQIEDNAFAKAEAYVQEFKELHDQSPVIDRMKQLVQRLPIEERRVLNLRLGLSEGVIFPLQIVAEGLKLSKTAVRQIELSGAKRLEALLATKPKGHDAAASVHGSKLWWVMFLRRLSLQESILKARDARLAPTPPDWTKGNDRQRLKTVHAGYLECLKPLAAQPRRMMRERFAVLRDIPLTLSERTVNKRLAARLGLSLANVRKLKSDAKRQIGHALQTRLRLDRLLR